MVPRGVLNSSGNQASDALCPTAMITLSTAKRSGGTSRLMLIGEALMAPAKRAGCKCKASTLPLPCTAVIARPCSSSTPSSSMSCRSSDVAGISCWLPSTVIMVTSVAPCRSASRAQSIAVLPPPMTATRAPSLTLDVPIPMSRRKGSPEHTLLILTFGSHAVGLSEAHGQHAGVVVPFQVVPGDVLPHLDVGLDRHPELDEALDLAIEHVLREHPVRNAAAIESTCFRRFLKDRHLVTEAGKLVGRAVAGGTRADDGDFLAVGRPGLDH